MIQNYYTIKEFLEEHCDKPNLDPVGRKVYTDDFGVRVTLLTNCEVLFEYEGDGYSIRANQNNIYMGYDELRNKDTLFVVNRFEAGGRDLILAKFKHKNIVTEG